MRITFKTFDEMLPLSKLKKSKHQRNKHPQDQIIRLAKIMEAHGVRHPIHISRLSGQVCFGHGRWEAAKLNKYTEYPVVYQDFKDDDEEYACVQSDNAIASWAELGMAGINLDLANLGPDFDIDLLGIKDFVLEPAEKFHADQDEVPEQVEATAKLGDIWQLGEHRLMCGDSTSIDAVENLMAGEKADMVFTDPPYGLADKWQGGTWGSKPMYKDAKRWDQPMQQEHIQQIFSFSKNIILWGGNYYSMPGSRCWISWRKSQQMPTMADFELAWTSFDKPSKEWTSSRNSDGNRVHPTQKPVALAEWCFENYADPKSVLDLFGGSGSTLIACEKTNRKCFMMELDPHYCDVIVARWEKYTNKKAVLLNGKAQTTIRRSANRKTSDDSLSER